MFIEYINHACILIDTGKEKILTDPWLDGPSWANNLWLFPKSNHVSDYFKDIDYIYISHGHEDHLHKKSIEWLPEQLKEVPIIVPDFGVDYFVKTLNKYGLKNLHFLKDNERKNMSEFLDLKMFINESDHDSSLLISSNNTNIFLQTDNLMTNDQAKKIGEENDIDICFTITCQTGPFPGFYRMSEDDMRIASKNKRDNSQKFSLNLMKILNPKYVIPYASDVCYFNEDLFANPLHKDDKESYKKLVEDSLTETEVIVMYPHDSINIERGVVKNRSILSDNVQNNLDLHYSRLKPEADLVYHKREKDNFGDLDHYADKFYEALNQFNHEWDDTPFNVIWEISDGDSSRKILHQKTGDSLKYTDDVKDHDLFIFLDLYRLKHLVNGDYAMGFLSLWNGGFKCQRKSMEYNPIEKKFWRWVRTVNLSFGYKGNDNEHS
mgnify:CR=1 FL=1|tara:strand:+ start:2883 stop:4190 length:1308 start_codon:yes stop_codon:yes gene_type:complete